MLNISTRLLNTLSIAIKNDKWTTAIQNALLYIIAQLKNILIVVVTKLYYIICMWRYKELTNIIIKGKHLVFVPN